MELDEMEQTLQDIFDKIKDFTTNDEKIPAENGTNIADTINKISIQADALTNYWNNSVKNLSKKIDDYFNSTEFRSSNSAQGENKNYRDAGFSFSTSPYVKPDENVDGDTYEESRTDAMTSVLKNKDYLDYTISAEELSEQVTRLLMPQNARRVEVEDLNRNFWVIGQNLTALNNTISKLNNDILKNLLYELVKLWQNVYRIWQGIAFLYDYVNKIVENITIQNDSIDTTVLISYGFMSDSDNFAKVYGEYITNNKFLPIDKYNAKNFGILPYIKEVNMNIVESTQDNGNVYYNEKTGNSTKYLYYMPYNQLLTDEIINKLEQDYSQNKIEKGIKYTRLDNEYLYNLDTNVSKTQPSFIQIDSKAPYRSTKEILDEIRARNFVLVYPTDKKLDILPTIVEMNKPNSSFLRLYRDYLYYGKDSDLGEPVASILKTTLNSKNEITDDNTYRTIKQIAGLDSFYANEEDKTSAFNDNVFTDENKNICNYIKSTFCKEYDLPTHFIDAFSNSTSITDFKEKLNKISVGPAEDNETGTAIDNSPYAILVNEFYLLCLNYLKKLCPTKLIPAFFVPSSAQEYTITKEDDTETIKALTDAIEQMDIDNSEDGQGKYTGVTNLDNKKLESEKVSDYIQWDLLSMVLDESLDMTDKTNDHNDYPSGRWLREKPIIKNNLDGTPIDDIYFGTEYIFFRKNPMNLKINFVENAYFKTSNKSPSKIGSFTFNEFHGDMFYTANNILTYDPIWYERTTANFNISIPFTIPSGITYENFIRGGKPYPNIKKILETNNGGISSKRFKNGNSDTDKTLSDSYYKDILNANYATVSEELRKKLAKGNAKYQTAVEAGVAIDGFYGQNRYLYKEELEYMGGDFINGQDHPPIFYLNALPYGIASSDLTDSKADIKCQTRRANTNCFESPVLNLRYINSGNNWQEIEIILTKDMTGFFNFPEPEVIKPDPPTVIKPVLSEKPLQAVSVKIGDFYPVEGDSSTTLPKKDFHEIDTFDPKELYNISTYGLGSYYMESETWKGFNENNKTKANDALYALKYVDYCSLCSELQKTNEETVNVKTLSKLDEEIKKKDNGENPIVKSSKEYIKKLKEHKDTKENSDSTYAQYLENKLIYTKIGKEGWQGNDGSQWRSGILCHMYYMLEDEPYLLGEIMRYDGYFDDLCGHQETETTHPCFYASNRHRHLILAEDSGIKPFVYKGESDDKKGYFLPKKITGYVLWFDKSVTGTWNQKADNNGKLDVRNDLICRPSKGTSSSVYYEGNKKFKSDEEFRKFVRDSFLSSANMNEMTEEQKSKYSNYERLVAVVPFEITMTAPDSENQDLENVFPTNGGYNVEKIKQNYVFVKDLNSIKNMGKMDVLDGYSLVRYSCLDNRPGFTHIYKRKTENGKETFEKNDVFKTTDTGMAKNLMTSLLPPVSVYNQQNTQDGNFQKDPTVSNEAVSFIGGQKAYFPITPESK